MDLAKFDADYRTQGICIKLYLGPYGPSVYGSFWRYYQQPSPGSARALVMTCEEAHVVAMGVHIPKNGHALLDEAAMEKAQEIVDVFAREAKAVAGFGEPS